jgi:hypothetical protein
MGLDAAGDGRDNCCVAERRAVIPEHSADKRRVDESIRPENPEKVRCNNVQKSIAAGRLPLSDVLGFRHGPRLDFF